MVFFCCLRALQDCPDAALDLVTKICEGLTAAHRNVVVRKLAELELENPTANSSG